MPLTCGTIIWFALQESKRSERKTSCDVQRAKPLPNKIFLAADTGRWCYHLRTGMPTSHPVPLRPWRLWHVFVSYARAPFVSSPFKTWWNWPFPAAYRAHKSGIVVVSSHVRYTYTCKSTPKLVTENWCNKCMDHTKIKGNVLLTLTSISQFFS